MKKDGNVICVDFDGTCTTHDYPYIGKDIGAIPVLKLLIDNGHKLVLFTMRSGVTLNEAVHWFNSNGIELYGIQTNPTQKHWTSSPKAYGQLYIDDASLGCPLIYDKKVHDRPYVDWSIVEGMLWDRGYFEFKPQIAAKDVDISKVKVSVWSPDKNTEENV